MQDEVGKNNTAAAEYDANCATFEYYSQIWYTVAERDYSRKHNEAKERKKRLS